MQLLQSTKAEGVEWIKILENIVVIVDANKIEASTNGEWRVIICRCVSYLIDEKACCEFVHLLCYIIWELTDFAVATAKENFPHAAPLILRLASLGGPVLSDLPNVLNLAVICLQSFEKTVSIPEDANEDNAIATLSCAPHRSFTIHQRLSSPTLNHWGTLLELLWESSMSLPHKCDAWEALTPRMLLWRACRPHPHSQNPKQVFDAVEWARKEVVHNLR